MVPPSWAAAPAPVASAGCLHMGPGHVLLWGLVKAPVPGGKRLPAQRHPEVPGHFSGLRDGYHVVGKGLPRSDLHVISKTPLRGSVTLASHLTSLGISLPTCKVQMTAACLPLGMT